MCWWMPATFSMFPAQLLRTLGMEALEEMGFILADGARKSFQLGEVRLRISSAERPIAIFGPEGRSMLWSVSF